MFISKGIVEQHGGSLTVSSPGIDMGASVAVELPICGGFRSLPSPKCSLGEHRSTGPVKPEKVSISAPPQTQPPQALMSTLIPEMLAPHAEPKKGKLLIADDSSTNRKFLTRLLGAHGFDCEGAEDGQQALDMYEAARLAGRPFDAILLDNQMPVMDGPTATKHLREMGCDSFILGVTGNVMQQDTDVFYAHGANAVLAKPLRIEIFENMMASLFSKNSSSKKRFSRNSSMLNSRNSSTRNSKPNLLSKPNSLRGAKIYADNMSSLRGSNIYADYADNTQNV
mmetsp:Transcript_25848/g.55884  ORF Transcript_25848/g.55884 Transcript_25848/m.55884 type:complete len:282 (-) Transcript_25848:414-1259(-)